MTKRDSKYLAMMYRICEKASTPGRSSGSSSPASNEASLLALGAPALTTIDIMQRLISPIYQRDIAPCNLRRESLKSTGNRHARIATGGRS